MLSAALGQIKGTNASEWEQDIPELQKTRLSYGNAWNFSMETMMVEAEIGSELYRQIIVEKIYQRLVTPYYLREISQSLNDFFDCQHIDFFSSKQLMALTFVLKNRDGAQDEDLLSSLVSHAQERAEANDPIAQSLLGYMNHHGYGVPLNAEEGIQLYEKAAEQGEPFAQYVLGVRCSLGPKFMRDDKQADSWFRKAAWQGFPLAQNTLGTRYYEGAGVPRDERQAIEWILKSANQGSPVAWHNLGDIYSYKNSPYWNPERAVMCYEKAAKLKFDDHSVNYERRCRALKKQIAMEKWVGY